MHRVALCYRVRIGRGRTFDLICARERLLNALDEHLARSSSEFILEQPAFSEGPDSGSLGKATT